MPQKISPSGSYVAGAEDISETGLPYDLGPQKGMQDLSIPKSG